MSGILIGVAVTALLLMMWGPVRQKMKIKTDKRDSAARNEAGFSEQMGFTRPLAAGTILASC
jgi:hypothetical protein